jgi:HK97 family phage portal protein
MKIFGYDIEMKRAGKQPAPLPKETLNQVYEALYRLIGNNMAILMPDNLENYIKQGYAMNSDLYSIINYIITSASSIPYELLQKQADGTLKPPNEREERIINFRNLLKQPNPHYSWPAYVEAQLGYKLITGNCYGYKIAAPSGIRKGEPLGLYVMPAHFVDIVGGSITEPVGGYRIRLLQTDPIERELVFHSKYFNPDTNCGGGSDLYGMSPIKAMIRLLSSSNAGFEANVSAFQNGGATGIITPKPTPNDSEQIITKEQWDEAKRKWAKNETGTNNFNKVAFLSQPIDYHRLGLSPVDLAIIAAMNLTYRQQCRIFKFPSVLLNDNETSTYNNVSEAKKMFYTDCLMPELNTLYQDMHEWLVVPFGEDLVLRPDFSKIEVLQENKQEKAVWLHASWGLTPNQRNEALGFPKSNDPLMDKVYIPSSLIPLEDAAAPMPSASPDLTEPIKELELLGVMDYKERTNGNGKH